MENSRRLTRLVVREATVVVIFFAIFQIYSPFGCSIVCLTTEQELETNEFYRLRMDDDRFVDKSLFIREYLNCSWQTIFISRPEGWGKTVNMKMLKAFLEAPLNEKGEPVSEDRSIGKTLFFGGTINNHNNNDKDGSKKALKPLEIARTDDVVFHFNGSNSTVYREQGAFPVIYVTFANATGTCYREIEDNTRKMITDLFQRRSYLPKRLKGKERTIYEAYRTGNVTRDQLENSLVVLSNLTGRYFGRKPHILIDDYDAVPNRLFASLLNRALNGTRGTTKQAFDETFKSKELTEAFLLFRGLLYRLTNWHNNLTDRILISGIQPSLLMSGDPCDITENNVRDGQFFQFYGFFDSEVDRLSSSYDKNVSIEDLKDWYGGYSYGAYSYDGQHLLYNPASVKKCLSNGELRVYHGSDIDDGNSSTLRSWIDTVLLLDDVQETIQELTDERGRRTNVTVKHYMPRKIMWHNVYDGGLESVLLYHGYLNTADVFGNDTIALPNREIEQELSVKSLAWIRGKFASFPKDEIAVSFAETLSEIRKTKRTTEGTLKALSEKVAATRKATKSKEKELFYKAIEKCLSYMRKNDSSIVRDVLLKT